MVRKDLVSILIPCYNHEHYIGNCLDSIKNNSYRDIELVIINDGSTDNSNLVIEEWIEKNPTITVNYLSRNNLGLSRSLNELIERANGEYICLVASDDALTKDSIKDRVNCLLSNPEKYVAIGDAIVIDSEGSIIMQSCIEDLWKGDKKNYYSDEGLQYSVINEWSVPGPAMLSRKEVYNIIGKYPENLLCEDLNFYLQVFGRNLAVFVDKPVAYYRTHLLNTSSKPQLKRRLVESIMKSYLNNIKYYKFNFKLLILKKILGNFKLYILS